MTVEAVLAIMVNTGEHARGLIRSALPAVGSMGPSPCQRALETAIMTDRSKIGPEARTRLGLFIDKYL